MAFDKQPDLEGDLLQLRPMQADDFRRLYAVGGDPLLWEQHPCPERWKPDPFRDFFEESLTSGGALTVIERATGAIIGSSRFHGYDVANNEIEIGWSFLARSHWGGAYNGEMKFLMLDHAFRFVNVVVFLIHPINLRSQKATEKVGGVRNGWRATGDGTDCYLYEIKR